MAEHALRRAEARSLLTTRALETLQRSYTEELHRFVGSNRPDVMEAWFYARSAIENAYLRAATLKQVLALNLGPTPGSVEPSPRLVDELHCFLGFAAEAARGLAKLRLATASGYRAVHESLNSDLAELKARGAVALVNPDRRVADAANYWLECSIQLLQMATSLIESELQFVASALEEADRQRAMLEEMRQRAIAHEAPRFTGMS